MDHNANRFRPVFGDDDEGRTELEGLHQQLQAQLTGGGRQVEERLEELTKGTGRLVLADGSPVPAHWPVFKDGELVTVKDYTFRVGHIGAAHLLLEPTGPLLVGQAERTVPDQEQHPQAREAAYQKAKAREAAQVLIQEIGAAGPEDLVETATRAADQVARLRTEVGRLEELDPAWNKRLAGERLDRCRELWNAVAYLTTELSRALAHQDGHSKPSSTAREVLRIARVVQEGGPLGHQGPDLEPGVDALSLEDLDRVSGARTMAELARLRDEAEAKAEEADHG